MVKEIIKGVIIYGAGNAGKQVCDLILKKNKKGVYCFIDKDIKKIGKKYKSIKIFQKKFNCDLRKIYNSKYYYCNSINKQSSW